MATNAGRWSGRIVTVKLSLVQPSPACCPARHDEYCHLTPTAQDSQSDKTRCTETHLVLGSARVTAGPVLGELAASADAWAWAWF